MALMNAYLAAEAGTMYKEMCSEYIISIHLAQINWFHFAVEQSVTS